MTTLTDAFARMRIILATALLLYAGLRANLGPARADQRLLTERADNLDIVTEEAQRYLPLIASLPARGVVGYLQPDDWPAAAAERRFYLAEYSLTPRIVVMSTAPEYVIVVPEASVAGDGSAGASSRDPRLAGLVLLKRFDNGLRVFRRIR